jgi:hypothetical protein
MKRWHVYLLLAAAPVALLAIDGGVTNDWHGYLNVTLAVGFLGMALWKWPA